MLAKTHYLFLFILFAALSHSSTVYAQEGELRYVSDVLYVPLRSGAGNEFRIVHKGVKSGTQLTFIEQDEEETWSKVSTPNGTEGWIRSQYILSTPPAQLKLTQSLTENAQLTRQNNELREENVKVKAENKSLSDQLKNISTSSDEISNELSKIKTLSAGAIDLDRKYRELLAEHQMMKTEFEAAVLENDDLKNDDKMNFMFYGAGLLIAGMIITLVLPSLKPTKRYSEWR